VNHRTLVGGDESGGALVLAEVTVPANWEGQPLHHHECDEAIHVLAGELTFQLGEEVRTGGAGTFAFAPAGAIHALANRGGEPARFLRASTPAGVDEMTAVGPPIDAGAAAGTLPPPTARIEVRVRGADSDGRVAVMDNRVGAGVGGPPLHRHDFDEAFYVLAGELTFQLGDERAIRRAGELAFARRGAAHTFANFSGAEARQLIICTPAGFERYFQRMAAREAGVDPPSEALEPWPEVTRLGPPLEP
jgi:quercetin dioxygenase-like cupin family protein